MSHSVAIAVLCMAVAGVGAQWIAWRLKLPAIVLLFAVGLIVGPGLRVFEPSVAFGPALQPIVGLAVAIVVFEGGLALDVRELRAAGEGVLRLTMVALPISFVLAALAARLCAGMAWGAALLFGAITVVTGPTVVLPLLRNTRLERRASSFLKWEAIVNDPIGALLAAIVLSAMLAHGGAGGSLAAELAEGLVLAAGLGDRRRAPRPLDGGARPAAGNAEDADAARPGTRRLHAVRARDGRGGPRRRHDLRHRARQPAHSPASTNSRVSRNRWSSSSSRRCSSR